MVTIKTAQLSDAILIANMSRDTFVETFAEHNTKEDMDKFLSTQFTIAQLTAEVGVESNQFFIAYYNNIPSGYLFLKTKTHPFLSHTGSAIEISRLYAYRSFIGKGIGKALMHKAIDIAKTSAKQKIWLGVWEQNQRAIDFYTSFGFTKFSEHDFILGNDVQRDWLMERPL